MRNGVLRPALMLPNLEGKTRILVGHHPSQAELVRQHLVRARATIVTHFHLIPVFVADCPHETVAPLRSCPGILHVEPDFPVRALGAAQPWAHRRMKTHALYQHGLTGRGANVAVLDTGITDSHPHLNVAGGVNLIDRGPWTDHNGHGTAVASIIGDRTMTADGGTLGTAPGCSLYAVKVLGDRGIGSTASLIAGLEWSVDNRMHIVHMSVGTVRTSRSLRMACAAAYRAGCLLVAAAGNGGSRRGHRDTVLAPARFPSVLAVGAIGRHNRRAPFSATGPSLSLVAPGVDIPCAVPGGFQQQTGTSAAAAHVTGIAALLIEACSPTHRQLRRALGLSAHPCGPRHLYGRGRVDALRALAIAMSY